MNYTLNEANKFPSILQIVDTFGIRKLQNGCKAPTRLLVSIDLARTLARELGQESWMNVPAIRAAQYTDFFGMGVFVVPNNTISGEFDIDYVPCEHKPYVDKRDNDRAQENEWRSFYSRHDFHFGFDCPF